MVKNAFHINVKKVPEADVDAIDKLVKTGKYASRSAFIREAITEKLTLHKQGETGGQQ